MLKVSKDVIEDPVAPGFYDCRAQCRPEHPITSMKAHQAFYQSPVQPGNGDVYPLLLCNPGFDYWQRASDRIRLWRLAYTMWHYTDYSIGITGVSSNDHHRFTIVADRQPQAGVPTYDLIFQNTDTAGGAASAGWCAQSFFYRDRFHVIWDRHAQLGALNNLQRAASGISISADNIDSSDQPGTALSGILDLNGLVVTYKTGTNNSFADLNLYFCTVGALGTQTLRNWHVEFVLFYDDYF